MRALVLGADGFVGRHLVEHLRDAGDSPVEAVGPSGRPGPKQIPVDIRDAERVASVIRDVEPDAIYHLAAVAYAPDAAADLCTAVDITVRGTAAVLQAAAGLRRSPIVLVTGSSEVYGDPQVERIGEDEPLRPVTVYGATKVAQEMVALTFGATHDIPVIATRSFNHIGRGQRDSFVVPSFARQLRQLRSAAAPVIRVGNLGSMRDFSDVRDVVRAYRLLVNGSHAGVPVNVASGVGVSIGDILNALIDLSGVEASIEVDSTRVRRSDAPRVVGDPSRLHAMTGWTPAYSLAQTLADIWADAQQRW